MKNPRVTLSSAEIKSEEVAALPVADKKGGALDDVLKFLKFSDSDIQTIDAIKDTITTLASTLNWAVAAVNTIKGVLTLLGVFDPAKDNTLVALKAIGQRLEQIYGYLAQTAKNNEYQQAEAWRTDLDGLRNAVNNLSISRSPQNLNDARQQKDALQKSVLKMLAIPFGTIPFQRAAYQYTPATSAMIEPQHWIDYAFKFYMTQQDGTEVNYGDPAQELQAQIWDPGYYLDVLVQSLQLRILALSATEPAFRSTGLDREDLRQIYNALGTFITTWQNTMLETRVVGPIDPGLTVGGPSGTAHVLHHPYAFLSVSATAIPMGIIDPVSGISAFEPNFNDGFALYFVSWPNGGGYWVLTNYDAAVASAYDHRYQLRTRVLAHCGINTLQTIRDAIGDLIMGPMGSEFVDFSPVTFSAGALQSAGTESVSLGFIGSYSSNPGKTYTGTRYIQHDTKKVFRIPMARRTDVSQIQLGYTLGVSLGDGNPEQQIVLCPYDAASPNAAAFPSTQIDQPLQSDSATIYDVYQSDFFSVAQEEEYENTGSVSAPVLKLGDMAVPLMRTPPQRLYLNPRHGKVRAQLSITFQLDEENPESAFVGYATVSVRNLNPDQYRDGFMISIRAYETVMGTTGIADPDMKMTKMADAITLHFAPSFLVVGPDYFADKAEGLQRLGKMFDDINNRYVHYAAPSPVPDPMSKITSGIEQEQKIVAAVEAFRRMQPEEEGLMRARFQVPVIQGAVRGEVGMSGRENIARPT